MGLFSFLFGKAPTIDTPAPDIPMAAEAAGGLKPPLFQWPVTATNDAEVAPQHQPAPQVRAKWPVTLGDIFCAIEYTNAEGEFSRRRITMKSIDNGPNGLVLRAICHERRAMRMFRADRISCVITADGEVIAFPVFARNVLAIDPADGADAEDRDDLAAARGLREMLRPALSILIAAARSDDHIHPAEVDAILFYAEREAEQLLDAGQITLLTSTILDHLEPMIRAMRPQDTSIKGYLRRVLDGDDDAFDRFRAALQQVVRADDRIALSEELFLAELETMRRLLAATQLRTDPTISDLEFTTIMQVVENDPLFRLDPE